MPIRRQTSAASGFDSRPRRTVEGVAEDLAGSIRRFCGDKVLIQRCHQHKQRNICEHFADEQRAYWQKQLSDAYELFGYEEAKEALRKIHRELMGVNPSAARSLEEGFEETLTLHQLKVPAPL